MTPAELLTMADEATKSGAWVVTLYGANENGERAVRRIALGSDDFIQTDGGCYGPNEKNARLIALAPDLALLCAAADPLMQHLTPIRYFTGWSNARNGALNWLASLAELEAR